LSLLNRRLKIDTETCSCNNSRQGPHKFASTPNTARQKKLCSRQQPRLILVDKTPWPACSACGCATARIKPSVRKSNTEMTNRNHPALRKAKSSPTEAGRRTHARSGHTPSRRQNHGDSTAARFEAGTEKPRKKLQINRGAGNRALGTCSHAS
jgi:hypothetical protein